MPLKLGERVVTAMARLLISRINPEIATLEADRTDGLTIPRVATGRSGEPGSPTAIGVFDYERGIAEPVDGRPTIDVFNGDTEPFFTDTDLRSGRLNYVMPVRLRLMFWNDGQYSARQMERLRDVYSSALATVVAKNVLIEGTDDAIKAAWVSGLATEVSRDEQSIAMKFQIVLTASVRCAELV